MNEQLYAKQFRIIERCVAYWDDFDGPGASREKEVFRKEYGPYPKERAEQERLRLRTETEKELSSNRWAVRQKFNVAEQKMNLRLIEGDKNASTDRKLSRWL